MKKTLVLLLIVVLFIMVGCQAQQEVADEPSPKIEKRLIIRVDESDIFSYDDDFEGVHLKNFKQTITDDKIFILGELVVENDKRYRDVELQGSLYRVATNQTVGISQKVDIIGDVEKSEQSLYWFEFEFLKPEPDTYGFGVTISAEWMY